MTKQKTNGDTLGGIFEVVAKNVVVGLGSHTSWDEKLDGRIAQAFMSIQAVKAVEIGKGVENAGRPDQKCTMKLFTKTKISNAAQTGLADSKAESLTAKNFASVATKTDCDVEKTATLGRYRHKRRRFRRVRTFGCNRRSRCRGDRRSDAGDRARERDARKIRRRSSIDEMKRNFENYCDQLKGF